MSKIYDVVVKTGEYQDRQTGETRAQWKNVGAVMNGENGPFMMLDRTFNPAGLPNPDNRSNCLLSLFKPKEQGQQQGYQHNNGGQQQHGHQSAPPPQPGGPSDFNDDVPFAQHMRGAEYMV